MKSLFLAHPRCRGLSSDVKQSIQRNHSEVNTIEVRKIIARKQRKTSQVFTLRMTPVSPILGNRYRDYANIFPGPVGAKS